MQGEAPGVGCTAPATAWLEADGLWPVVSSVAITLTGCASTFAEPAHLAASNNPERIDHNGVLLDTVIGAADTTFYFHHQNGLNSPCRTLEVRLENRSRGPVDLLVMESGAGPSRDELYAGHSATWRGLRWMVRGNGLAVHLEPGDECLLDQRTLSPGTVACGIGQVMVMNGKPPHLVVEATSPEIVVNGPVLPSPALSPTADDHPAVAVPAEGVPGQLSTQTPESQDAGANGVSTPLPSPTLDAPARPGQESVRGRGLFGPPLRDLQATYVVGGPYAFVSIGGPPFLQPLGDGTPNVGNYGVMYRVHLLLSNPTAQATHVYVVFSVGGGVARGSLVVDGALVETPVLSTRVGMHREFQLGDDVLSPGQQRAVQIDVMPEPGSNYPVNIIAKDLPANR